MTWGSSEGNQRSFSKICWMFSSEHVADICWSFRDSSGSHFGPLFDILQYFWIPMMSHAGEGRVQE